MMNVQLPDGTIVRNVPDGTSKAQLVAKLKAAGYDVAGLEPPRADPRPPLMSAMQNLAGGALRGMGSIGATILSPIDAAGLGRDDRRQAMDDALAGFGLDTSSMPFQVGKLGAELAGTAGVGGLAARGATLVPPLAAALRSGGMAGGNIATKMAGGAGTGAASATLVNPDDALLGAIVGGTIPPAARAAGVLGQSIGQALTRSGAERSATARIADAIGAQGITQAVGDIQTHYPRGAENIPLSAAAILRTPAMASLEQASRLRRPHEWLPFDQQQARAVFGNVLQATDEAGALGTRTAARQANWADNWARAEQAVKPRTFARLMGQLKGSLDQAATSKEASNPAVLAVLKAIDNEVVRLGSQFSPGHLQQIRANLSGRMVHNAPDAYKAAPRDNPAIRTLLVEIDDILNQSTGGKWDKVRRGYAADSQFLHQAKAASKVRGAFIDADTGRIRSSVPGDPDTPQITAAGLSRAMDAARLPDRSLALSQSAERRLNATLEALRAQAIVQGVKRAASAGGGSDTASNMMAVGTGMAPHGGLLLQLADIARRAGTARTDTAAAGLLTNPRALAAALSQFQATGANPFLPLLAPGSPHAVGLLVGDR